MTGRTIGHYRIVAELGRGAWGTVYRAVDETLVRDVAVKVLNRDVADAAAEERFRNEATILAKLNHPAIATIYELFRDDADLFMVMEFVRGETLDTVSDRLGPMPPERAAYFIDRILSALGYAHDAGIVHSDMKPSNVMVTDSSGIKIMDFGIARVRGASRDGSDPILMGTPAYMPPEQVLTQEIDGRTDLYAVGVIFYRLLTGALPFEADTPVAVLQRQVADAPTPLRFHRDGLPAWCDTVLRRALAKAPGDRFQAAEEFRTALAQGIESARTAAAAPETIAPRRPTASTPRSDLRTLVLASTDASPKRRWLAAARTSITWASLLMAVAGIGVLAPTAFRRPRANAPEPTPAAAAVTAASPITPAPPAVARTDAPPAATRTDAAPPVEEVPPTKSAAPTERRTLAPRVAAPAPKARAAGDSRLEFATKALVALGEKPQVTTAKLVLGDGRLSVVTTDSTNRLLTSVPYDTVTAVSYSHSRDPLWRSPGGSAPIARVDRGTLATLLGISVERHWISVITTTRTRFIVLRVDDGDVSRLLSAIQERTGIAPQFLDERKRS